MEFKDLIVYQKALQVNKDISIHTLSIHELDKSLKDQLRRASLSIVLNIAEGSSRFSPADRKNFFVIARGSTFECAAILDVVGLTVKKEFLDIALRLEEISKMLYKMIDTLRGHSR